MARSRILPVLAAAWLVTVAGCSDTIAPSRSPTYAPVGPIAPPLITLSGLIHSSETKINGVAMTTADGQDIFLVSDGGALPRVDKAGVDVRGRWSVDGTFLVTDFLVRSVDGESALDGVLVAVFAPTIIDSEPGGLLGYALRLTDGSMVSLMDPPADLCALVGDRLWVVSPTDGPPTAFGVIE